MLERIYHPISDWEEIPANMWGESTCKLTDLNIAIALTSNHEEYGEYMRCVTKEWKYSCENALTDKNLNRKAWLGHAAVAYAHNIPEDITREAWGHLTDEQRILANNQAERAISEWEERFLESIGILPEMGGKVLSLWDT